MSTAAIELPILAPRVLANDAPANSLLDRLLADQQSLTAVEEFSRWHSEDEDFSEPAQSRNYRSLLPASPPGPGQQYAFEVDLDRCSGCKACVTACHSLNGLDETETWRDVGLLIGGSSSLPVIQHVTTACHHCLEPACMSACPVNAYEKDPLTGIVKHLDDQCFGCQYCTLACPYDVPKYHAAKGIVRKCDMCSSRLAVGEAPACVQACPHQAIAIRAVDVRAIVEDAEASPFLPAAPDPQFTLPATTFKTKRPFPRNMLPADYTAINPQHPHWPLIVMLVLTQLSVGSFGVGLWLRRVWPEHTGAVESMFSATALVFGLVALAASTLHLGRPQFAFRAVLGLGHSWLSREIVVFGLFAGLAMGYAASVNFFADDPRWRTFIDGLGWLVVAVGAVAVFCSAMIYAFTRRELWSATRTCWRFALTATLLGLATVWLCVLFLAMLQHEAITDDALRTTGRTVCVALMAVAGVKLVWELSIARHLLERNLSSLRRSALLMSRQLAGVALGRFAAGLLGGIIMPAFLLSELQGTDAVVGNLEFVIIAGMLFLACLVGELLERYLFFAAVAAPRMPGGIRQ